MPSKDIRHQLVCCLALACLLAVPLTASAAADTIYSGIDVWTTPGNGSTFTDFANRPLPASFFCAGSEPFTGRIEFQGLPIANDTGGDLGSADTIIHRLDDAVFDTGGVATTRIQVRALSLVSSAPVATSCGDYRVFASLTGDQPITEMKIYRENPDGGTFEAPLQLNVKLEFVPLTDPEGETLELIQRVSLAPGSLSVWARRPLTKPVADFRHDGFLQVDTDGDEQPDIFLPGTSNFLAGTMSSAVSASEDGTPIEDEPFQCCVQSCHCNPDADPEEPENVGVFDCRHCEHLHCVEVQVSCDFQKQEDDCCTSQIYQCGDPNPPRFPFVCAVSL